MNMLKRMGIVVAAWLAIGGLADLGEVLHVQGISAFVSTAEAVVGRPLTPVSVAGVSRRTGRRCATGVYDC